MNGRIPIPPKVRRTIPMMGSPVDPEALNACRITGQILNAAGLSFVDLAAAIPVAGDEATVPAFEASGWQAAARPAPPHRPSRKKTYVFTPRQTAEHREMVAFCRKADWTRLSPREREFVSSLASWRGELTIPQADWLTDLCDRLEQEDRWQWQ